MTMLHAIIFLFLLAAGIGLFLLTRVLRNKYRPKSVAMFHGSFALLGLLMLAVFTITRPFSYWLIASLVLFILAALGGLTMFIMDVNKKPFPKAISIIHPLIALSALTLLIIYLLQ